MAILNITYNGRSDDVPGEVDFALSDEDVRKIAAEMHQQDAHVFDHFVVDRFDTARGGQRIYLRPKVPFGNGREEHGGWYVHEAYGVCWARGPLVISSSCC